MDIESQHALSMKRLKVYLGEESFGFSATQYRIANEQNLKPRDFIYGKCIIRNFVSLLVAPGGVGKTALTILEAMSLATGKDLLGKPVYGGPYRVLILGLEDPIDETVRRISAARRHYKITSDDLGGEDCRLFINSGRDQKFCITIVTRDGVVIDEDVVQDLIMEIKRNKIDVVIIDPFVSSHSASENDNVAMDAVAKAWANIAEKANCAILLVHHSRKLNGEQISAEAARGASSVLAAVRSGRVIQPMSASEAAKAGLESHRGYFQVIDDKSNLAPPIDHSEWYRIVNVILSNGDHVGVVERWQLPNPHDAITPEIIMAVQNAVMGQGYREHVQATKWVGHIVGQIVGFDTSIPTGRYRASTLMKSWIDEGYFIVDERDDESRRPRKFIEVSKFIQLAPPTNSGAEQGIALSHTTCSTTPPL